MSSRPLILTGLFFLLIKPEQVEANIGTSDSYFCEVFGNQARICFEYSERHCPEPAGVLRENVDTGEVLKLDQFCTEYKPECYLDECVPPGNYRYGLVVPFTCTQYGTSYYCTVEVTEELDDCTPSADNEGPSWYGDDPPWAGDKDGKVCKSTYDPYGETFTCTTAIPGRAREGLLFALLAGVGLMAFRLTRRDNTWHRYRD